MSLPDWLLIILKAGVILTAVCWFATLVMHQIDEQRMRAYHRRLRKLQKKFGPWKQSL